MSVTQACTLQLPMALLQFATRLRIVDTARR